MLMLMSPWGRAQEESVEVIWIAVAFILGLLANALGLPPLLGYLGGGFLLGTLGVEGGELLHSMSHYGVIFLLFTLGLHIRLRNMVQTEVIGGSLGQILASVVLLSMVFFVVGLHGSVGVVGVFTLAVLLGVASTVVAAKSLEERQELEAYHGRVAISILIIEDLILIGILAFAGLQAPSPWALGLLVLPLLRPLLLRLVHATKHGELQLLYGLLLALGGATLFGGLGLSEELGAFVAGVLISGDHESDRIAERLWSLREGFLVAFFLEIGLHGLPSWSGLGFALALVLFLPLRVAIFFGLLTRLKLRARTAFFASAALASYSEFAIITGAAAAQAGYIPAEMVVVLALAVAFSFAFGAPFNRAAPALYMRFKPYLLRFERDVRHPDAQPETLGSARYIVVGMGRTGIAAYDALAAMGERVVGLDTDPAKIEAHRHAGRRIAYGDAGDSDLWEDLKLERIHGIILTIPELQTKVQATHTLRGLGYRGVINTTRLTGDEYDPLEAAGASSICHPLNEAGIRLAEQTRLMEAAPVAVSVSVAPEPLPPQVAMPDVNALPLEPPRSRNLFLRLIREVWLD